MRPGFSGLVLAGLVLTLLAACAEREVILPGPRFDVTVPLDASLPKEGEPAPVPAPPAPNRSVAISLPAQVRLAEWTHRGSNPRHLAPHSALSAQPVRIWSAPIGQGNSRKYRIAATPVVANGRIFTMDARATVTATSTGGGTLWSASVTPSSDPQAEGSGGGLAFGDGRLFVTTSFGELLALDPATGGVLWRQRLGAPVTGAPTVLGGIVYVVARDSSAWAVNAADGTLRWQLTGAPSTAGMIVAASPAVTDRLAVLPLPSGEVVGALRLGGVQTWSSFVKGERVGRGYTEVSSLGADPVVAGATTYIGNLAGRTVALGTDTGTRQWTADQGAYSMIAVAGGSVFLVNDQADLVRLDASSGEVIWSVDLPYFVKEKPRRQEAIFAHFGPVLAGGRLVVASSDGVLRFFSPTDGSLVGTVDLPGGGASIPVVVGGVLYVVGGNGQLHAFR
jgi:outer membrane protein assembly factor BamB